MDLLEAKGNIFRHPWELSRADSLIREIKKVPKDWEIADIGAGDLYFSNRLSKFFNRTIKAVDPSFSSTEVCNPKIKKYLNHLDLNKDEIDGAVLLDVLEHVENDKEFLSQVYGLVKSRGKIFITVPAWNFLFTQHDHFLKHFRRYNHRNLKGILDRYEIENYFYFYFTLLPIRFLEKLMEFIRLKKPKPMKVSGWPYPENHLLTKIVRKILNIDFSICLFFSRFKIRIPGLSLCMILKKK